MRCLWWFITLAPLIAQAKWFASRTVRRSGTILAVKGATGAFSRVSRTHLGHCGALSPIEM